MTHFDVFGLAPAAELDVKALEQRYRELSLEHHPDRAGADPRARLMALEKTTALNDAFKVLRDPIKRAFYLLKLRGIDLEQDVPPPPEFLEEILEQRERLEEVKAAKDAVKARAMADDMAKQRDQALARAVDAFKRDAVREAALQLVRVRYFIRFVEEVDAFEEELVA